MKPIALLLCACMLVLSASAQTNITLTNPVAHQILNGNYTPADYASSDPIAGYDAIICNLDHDIDADSLQHHLTVLSSYHNRNTYSDTVSNNFGIGAARRWAHQRFEGWSATNENRLVVSYLQFDHTSVCGPGQFRNVLGILPGTDNTAPICIIEAHMDLRCEDVCDPNCQAHGADDNGSGTALVMELARVMSRFTFEQTIVFMLTVGEEQGLLGAEAMSKYCLDNGIAIEAVQNNDIVGGVECGQTSSPPSCAVPYSIDSMAVRVFSQTGFTSQGRSMARWIQLMYNEKLNPIAMVPMQVRVMNQIDRTGRGGDHEPFITDGFNAVRFTSNYEHGHGAPDTTYSDRQHTTDDVLGLDTDGDLEVDSFFVDFNYLKRNTVINGTMITLLSNAPAIPDWELQDEPTGLKVKINEAQLASSYRVGVRLDPNEPEFVGLYRFSGTNEFLVPGTETGLFYLVSVAAVDGAGLTGMFSTEVLAQADADTDPETQDMLPFVLDCEALGVEFEAWFSERWANIELLPCKPNPSNGQTEFRVRVNQAYHQSAELRITDMMGRQVDRMPLLLSEGDNSIPYTQPADMSGIYFYTLVIDNRIVASRKLVVTQ